MVALPEVTGVNMQEYEHLKQLVEQCAVDLEKAEGGNKVAGTRARKAMQEIRQTAQAIRVRLLELRGNKDSSSPEAPSS
jgi:predicted transcriptional regulator